MPVKFNRAHFSPESFLFKHYMHIWLSYMQDTLQKEWQDLKQFSRTFEKYFSLTYEITQEK